MLTQVGSNSMEVVQTLNSFLFYSITDGDNTYEAVARPSNNAKLNEKVWSVQKTNVTAGVTTITRPILDDKVSADFDFAVDDIENLNYHELS